jgi:hypothetical protein
MAGPGDEPSAAAGEENLRVPEAVEQFVARLLAKRPEDRPQTPAEVAAILGDIQSGLDRGAVSVPTQPQKETLVEFDLTPRSARDDAIAPTVVANVPAAPASAPATPAATPAAPAAAPAAESSPDVAVSRSRAAQHWRIWPWIVVPGLALLTLLLLAGVVALVAMWPSGGGSARKPEIEPSEPADEAQWKKLLAKSHRKPAPAAMSLDLLHYRTQFPVSVHAREVDEWLSRLPSPLDRLDPIQVPKAIKAPPEMVALLGEQRRDLKKPADVVAISPDGRWLVGSEDADLRLWDTAHLDRPAIRWQPHGKRVHAAAFAPDARRLATAGDDAAVRLWDPATRERLFNLEKHKGPVTRLAFRRHGTLLASAGTDAQICLWDPVSGSDVGSIPITGPVHALAFSPDGQTLFWGAGSQSAGFHVHWAPIARGAAGSAGPRQLETPGARVLTFAPDGRTLLCGGEKGRLLVCTWDGKQLTTRTTIAHQDVNPKKQALPINQAVFTPDGKTVATAGADHRVQLWDAREVKSLFPPKDWNLRCPVVAAVFAPDSRHLVTGNANSTLAVFRLSHYPGDPAK